jgi:hypothetical protein
MRVAAGDGVVIIREIQISGNEPCGDSKRAQRRDHKRRKVATASASELQGPVRILGPLLVPTHVFEGPPDGLGRVDKKLAGVGRSVLSEKPDSPAIELSGRGQRRNEGRKVRPIFRGVGKRMGSGKILDTGSAEASWRVVDANGAFEAKLRGPFCETDDRDMIAKSIPRPGKLTRLRRDFQLGFKHLLVVVVARMQHHPVLAECDRLPVVIRRDVPDGEDRHSQFHHDASAETGISSAKKRFVSVPSGR